MSKIIVGDCLTEIDKLPDDSVDLLLTDPPYGMTNIKWDKPIPLGRLWEKLMRVGKNNCCYIFMASQPFTTDLINSNRNWFKYELIWEKTRPTGIAQAAYRPMKIHENILIFYKSLPIYNPIKEDKIYKGQLRKGSPWKTWNTSSEHGLGKTIKKTFAVKRFPTSVLHVPSLSPYPKGSIVHPTQKPLPLMKYLINTYSNEGDTVLDPFAGSGSTLLAAKELNRRYIGIEVSSKYVEIAERRLKQEVLL